MSRQVIIIGLLILTLFLGFAGLGVVNGRSDTALCVGSVISGLLFAILAARNGRLQRKSDIEDAVAKLDESKKES